MIRRPLWTIPINDSILSKFKEAGYEYCEEVFNSANSNVLSQLFQNTSTEQELKKLNKKPFVCDAFELLQNEVDVSEICNIASTSKNIDRLFNTGIPIGQITQIFGPAGSGKTQLCLQLCVTVQIPEFLGGINGVAVYINTNSNFSAKRIEEMHKCCISHCAITAKPVLRNEEYDRILHRYLEKDPFHDIIQISVHTVDQLIASILRVEKLLTHTSKNIRLVVIDSMTFPFNQIEASLERTELVSRIMAQLLELATHYRLAVIVVNNLTSRMLHGTCEVMPSLGESFAQTVHHHLYLNKVQKSVHSATLLRSTDNHLGSVKFQIVTGGINDLQ